MSFTHTMTVSHLTSGGAISKSVAITASGEQRISESFASDASDQAIVVSIPADETKAVTMLATADCTLEYNDGSGTQGTIELAANLPVTWYTGAPWTMADVMGYDSSAVDITALYLTADGAAGTIEIIVLTDATPE